MSGAKEKKKYFEVERKKWLIEMSKKIEERANAAKTDLNPPGDQENDNWLITGVWRIKRSGGV